VRAPRLYTRGCRQSARRRAHTLPAAVAQNINAVQMHFAQQMHEAHVCPRSETSKCCYHSLSLLCLIVSHTHIASNHKSSSVTAPPTIPIHTSFGCCRVFYVRALGCRLPCSVRPLVCTRRYECAPICPPVGNKLL
jgi:hypothetical protein